MKRRNIEVDSVFDIETESWDKFVLGGFYTHDDGFSAYEFPTEDEYADKILSSAGWCWAHNGGKYDTLFVVDKFLKRYTDEAKVYLAGQRIVCLEIGDLEIRDSAALMPMSLKQAAEIGGHKKHETDLPCVCGQDCGGYCSIRRDMPREYYERLKEYLRYDCLSLHSSLVNLREYAEQNDLDLASTVGASAWATAKRWADLPPAKWKLPGRTESKLYTFVSLAYKGGRTQVGKIESPHGRHVDVNSAYIHALRSIKIPVGGYRELGPRESREAYRKGLHGVYQAIVKVADQHIPPLPYRGKERLYYPIGEFDGVWTLPELNYAEKHGSEIRDLHRAVVWESADCIFQDFCERVWSLRDRAGPKTGLGVWLKFFGNSLTGKLAQHPLMETVELHVKEFQACPGPRRGCTPIDCVRVNSERCCRHGCSGWCGRHIPLDKEQKIWSRLQWQMPSSGHVHWAAYLTGHQRNYLHEGMISDGEDGQTWVYSDTDSLFSERRDWRHINIGKDLGQWKDEGLYLDFTSLAPKTYSYIEVLDDGVYGPYRRVARAKGIIDPDKNWDRIANHEKIDINRGVKSFKQAIADMKNGKTDSLFSKKEMVRGIAPQKECDMCGDIHIGDRNLNGLLTTPRHINSIVEHERRSIREHFEAPQG